MPNWSNFFVAEAGAAAALAGLLFVAVSINLVRILEFPHLPTRAAEALIALLSVLFVASFALIPGQSLRTFGIEIAATGMAVWTFQAVALTRTRTRTHPRVVLRVLMNQVPPLPFLIGGALLIGGHPHGVYWLVPGVFLAFTAGTFGAWVLLIEIQR
jgi:hypothetical protein